jgi:SET and MYND domain-containing protein
MSPAIPPHALGSPSHNASPRDDSSTAHALMTPDLDAWLATRGLCIQQRPGRGRCLVTTTVRAQGDTLLETPPFACVALDDVPACDACCSLKNSEAQLRRCTGCRTVRYCNAACQRSAWSAGHNKECPALAHVRASHGVTPPPSLRLAHRVLLRHAGERSTAAPHDAPDLVRALETHRQEAGEKLLVNAAQATAALLSLAGSDSDTPAAWRIPLDASVVTDTILALSVNAHAVCDAELRPVGRGLYPLVACCNHDCAPTAVLTFRGNVAQLRATRALEADTEVCISYIDLTATAGERRAELQEGYHFTCACRACSAAFSRGGCPSDKQLGGVACADCGAALPLPPASPACCVCGSNVSHAAAVSRHAVLTRVKDKLVECKRLRAAGQHSAALLCAQEGLACSAAEPSLSSMRTRALDGTLHAAVDAEDWALALQCAKACVGGMRAAHGDVGAVQGAPASPVLGLHYATLGRLLWHAASSGDDLQAAAEALDVAVRMLGMTHGRDHPVIATLRV